MVEWAKEGGGGTGHANQTPGREIWWRREMRAGWWLLDDLVANGAKFKRKNGERRGNGRFSPGKKGPGRGGKGAPQACEGP